MNSLEVMKLEQSRKNIKLIKSNDNTDGITILNSNNNEIRYKGRRKLFTNMN